MRRVPGYCLHRSSGRGYARFGTGRPTYFPGRYDSRESKAAYDAALAEYLSAGRTPEPVDHPTVAQLTADWLREAEARYVKFGRQTRELGCQKIAFRFVLTLYRDLPARDFGPRQLTAVRQQMIDAGWVRSSINLHVCRIRAVWKLAASRGVVPLASYQLLCTLAGLRKGKCMAREPEPKRPVTWQQLRAVLRRCSPMIGAMVRLQYLNGMRPGEVVALRAIDLDRSGELWRYVVRPEVAKTGKETCWLGPRSNRILTPWLLRAGDGPVFTYSVTSYRCHVNRCCRAAGIQAWSPHQLRHNHGTRVRDLYGRDAAQERLNHSDPNTTDRYSRTSSAMSQKIARDIG